VIESSHPYDNMPMNRAISIPGATCLSLFFQDTCRMGADDIIRISGKHIHGHEQQVYELKGLDRGTDIHVTEGVAIGDKVVRGPSWVSYYSIEFLYLVS
jgi:hypothetical protein